MGSAEFRPEASSELTQLNRVLLLQVLLEACECEAVQAEQLK
ncbi:hypothetical protein SynA1562_01906 [Synechococcus sp. A15-62]|nr:hypothetical protein SynA1562_01906 [Synechococcus sp. A15-62]